MRPSRRRCGTVRVAWGVVVPLALLGLVALGLARPVQEAVLVEPTELARRDDLVGRVVKVDDRVRFYVQGRDEAPDELVLKRTPVVFRVPRSLRPGRPMAVVVEGELKREGDRLVCDVVQIEAVPNDLERLNRGAAQLGPRDSQTRLAWARWAERRAREFQEADGPLMKRARELEAEALRIQGDRSRLTVDAPREWLAMARDARRRKAAEPEPSALAHRAFRALLARGGSAVQFQKLAREMELFFPEAPNNRTAARHNLAAVLAPYAKDPAAAYRSASSADRAALDRRLWADAEEQWLEQRAASGLEEGLAHADEAERLLPERPELAARLRARAVAGPRERLARLRLDEAKELARAYREKLNQPDEAQKVLHGWLKAKREGLADTDAESALALAKLHEELIGDRVTAVELLRKAWKIDPTSREIESEFRNRGFRKIHEEWVESIAAVDPPTKGTDAGEAPNAAARRGLLGLTSEDVRLKMNGRPDRVSYTASKGQFLEHWIYHLDNNATRYVNLLHAPGERKARVIADYTLPRLVPKGGLAPAR